MQKETRPLGVSVLGGINFFIFGLGSLLVFSYVYLNSGSESFKDLLAEMGKYLPEASLKEEMIKKAILTQVVIALIFTLSGWGLLQRKEIARKGTLWFAFLAVAITFTACLFNPAIIAQGFLQIIYPGALIVYLTNKKVEEYFNNSKNIANQEAQD
ncbi:MAG: hypothetical protein K9L86_04945 [Candidatus Omnitrophica bacterium]|nr:hypothetical protein [Candidatus Omnitrophota bacterium]